MKTLKILIVGLAIGLMFSGCGNINRMEAQLTGVSEFCYDNVVYLQGPSGMTPKIGLDGGYVFKECK